MSQSIDVALSKDNDVSVHETVMLDNERVVTLYVVGSEYEMTTTPAEAEALGLALIRMAATARAKDERPEVFGESTTSTKSKQKPARYNRHARNHAGRGVSYTGRHAQDLDSPRWCYCGNQWTCRHAIKVGTP